MNKPRLIMQGGRRYHPHPGNIKVERCKLRDKWANGRPFRHGAMDIYFIFNVYSRISAEADVESFMEGYGLERGRDYHIPAWNYPSSNIDDFYKDHLTITFNNIEDFIMFKLGWDINDNTV